MEPDLEVAFLVVGRMGVRKKDEGSQKLGFNAILGNKGARCRLETALVVHAQCSELFGQAYSIRNQERTR